ncbi:GNAT family N-acetyltransferase [Streptomyces sp. ODS28]|uniref:GNAT family N-acetyltransferase n=1 Tax=Streptomyces sp. ODS28 TaxID=3136688 RepID=UPI0031EF555C
MIETRIVPLTSDDWRRWREVRLAALAEAPYAFGSTLADWQGAGDREERWRARLSIPGALDLLAVLDSDGGGNGGHSQPVGMASGVPGPHEGVVELISMWVSAAARGHGVGDRLVRSVLEWAAARHAHTVELAVMPGNAHAFALYRRHGFADLGPLGDVLPDGRREHLLRRALPTV